MSSYSGRSMNLEDIPHSLRDKTILVTGATGFLAKVLVEKILRAQPYVKKLYLLIRAPDSSAAKQRLTKEIFESELFRVPVGKWVGAASSPNIDNGVVVAVAGDVSEDNLGIKDNKLRANMLNEIDIIISSAATTKFDERYDFALSINTFGVKNVTEFAKRCVKLQMLLHVSTAYVRCNNNSTRVAQEEPFSMGETLLVQEGSSNVVLDINKEKQVVEEAILELQNNGISLKQQAITLKELGMKRAYMHGWANTYSFTKSMGEMILMNFHDAIPLVIVRPTIITSTYKDPFPSWTEGFKTIDSIAISYGQGKLKCFVGDPNTVVDLIPVDMVVNAMLVAIAVNANKPYSSTIYNIGSSMRNPFRSEDLQSFICHHFKKNPLITKNGKPIVPAAVKMFPSMESFHKHMKLRYIPLIKVLGVVSSTFCPCLKGLHSDLSRQISLAMRLSKLNEPYLFSQTIFDDKNTENLRRSYKKKEGESDNFEFDPICIDWEDYIMRIHLPGATKHIAAAK